MAIKTDYTYELKSKAELMEIARGFWNSGLDLSSDLLKQMEANGLDCSALKERHLVWRSLDDSAIDFTSLACFEWEPPPSYTWEN